jgi:hypothetical protein
MTLELLLFQVGLAARGISIGILGDASKLLSRALRRGKCERHERSSFKRRHADASVGDPMSRVDMQHAIENAD